MELADSPTRTSLSVHIPVLIVIALTLVAACYSAVMGLWVALLAALLFLLSTHARYAKAAAQLAQQHSVARDSSELILQLIHDVKNPLNVVAGTANMLLDLRQTHPPDSLAGEDVEYLEMICASAFHMSAIIADVQTMNADRADSRLPRQRCEVAPLLHQVLAAQRKEAERKGIQLELLRAEPFSAEVNADALQILFENLLNNAIKFSWPDQRCGSN